MRSNFATRVAETEASLSSPGLRAAAGGCPPGLGKMKLLNLEGIGTSKSKVPSGPGASAGPEAGAQEAGGAAPCASYRQTRDGRAIYRDPRLHCLCLEVRNFVQQHTRMSY